jgi:IPT/TIG domain
MTAQRAATALAVLLGMCTMAACGGGGGSHPAATPTLPLPTATPTRTPTPAAEVDVISVFPPIGSAAGGTSVLIEGAGFSEGGPVDVTFADAAAGNVIVLSDRELSCLAPAGEGGTVVPVRVSSSKGSDSLGGAFRYGGGGSPSNPTPELTGEPTVSFDAAIGTTTILVDYLVRDSDGVLLDDSDVDVRLFVDDEQLGAGGRFGESVLDRNAQELDLNVLVMLVLDASYSLQQFDPPQFGPTLNAAQKLVDEGSKIWRNRGGTFAWNVVWFDELISRPDPEHMRSFRIGNIPQPEPGNFTKLYSAISNGLEFSASLLAQGVAAGARDRHVLVVFTDGLDNLSTFNNPEVMREGRLRNGDPYPRVGWRATGLDDVLAEIAQHPLYPTNLTVHAIALGSSCSQTPAGGACFDADALGDIAQVGFGQLLASPRNVANLFDLIQREFTTLQSSGAVVALSPGDYQFRLVAERHNHSASGELRFPFEVGSNGAGLVPF